VALPVVVIALHIAAAAALAVTGQLTQLPSMAGCVSEKGSGGVCADGKALTNPAEVAVSPDARSVYVASIGTKAIAVFERDTATGELTQLAGTAGCVSETGTTPNGDACADGKALNRPRSVAVSADGKSVYVASYEGSAVAVFERNTTTGELTQLAGTAGCVSQTGSGGACAVGRALNGSWSVAVSADGESVYVASLNSDAVAVFKRDTATGELTQLTGAAGCVSETGGSCRDGKALDSPRSVAVSADGKSVYVTSSAVAVLRRNTTTGALFQPSGTGGCVSETGSDGACADGKALSGAIAATVSADGKNVYVASIQSDAVAVFRRDATSGALTQLAGPADKAGCVSETGSSFPGGPPGACAVGKALDGGAGVAVSADGKSVYVASFLSDAVAAFARTTSGALTQLAGSAGCVSQIGSTGPCRDGKALNGALSVALSADGKSVYVASSFSGAVAVLARETPP
jgi:DNA-binding beta-propeller fold protein YncE